MNFLGEEDLNFQFSHLHFQIVWFTLVYNDFKLGGGVFIVLLVCLFLRRASSMVPIKEVGTMISYPFPTLTGLTPGCLHSPPTPHTRICTDALNSKTR